MSSQFLDDFEKVSRVSSSINMIMVTDNSVAPFELMKLVHSIKL